MEEKATTDIKTHWYTWHRFSLLPVLKIRKADQWNTTSIHFNWLFFHVWTIDSPEIGASIMLDDQNLELRVRLPYLIINALIPIFPQSWAMKLWRKRKLD